MATASGVFLEVGSNSGSDTEPSGTVESDPKPSVSASGSGGTVESDPKPSVSARGTRGFRPAGGPDKRTDSYKPNKKCKGAHASKVHKVIKEKNWFLSAAAEQCFDLRKKCPKWIDEGTRGCPIPNGVLLAGSKDRPTAPWVNIIEIGYEVPHPVQIYLPHPVQAQAMVYDAETELLTMAGGIRFTSTEDPEVPNPCKQVWQLKLFTKDSQWESLPDLPDGVYDPVLLSRGGTLHVIGGYTKLTEQLADGVTYAEPTPEDGTTLCRVLGTKDKEWKLVKELRAPIDAPLGGAGVIHRGIILVITKTMAQKYEPVNDEWIRKDYDDTTIYKCTPAVGPDNKICAIAHYKKEGEDKQVGILEYDFATNKWTAGSEVYSPFYSSDVEVGAGRFMSLQLLPEHLA